MMRYRGPIFSPDSLSTAFVIAQAQRHKAAAASFLSLRVISAHGNASNNTSASMVHDGTVHDALLVRVRLRTRPDVRVRVRTRRGVCSARGRVCVCVCVPGRVFAARAHGQQQHRQRRRRRRGGGDCGARRGVQ